MPYIKQVDRPPYQEVIKDLSSKFADVPVGDMNYVISSVIKNVFEKNKSYKTANALMGMIECVKMEFYRTSVAPYEDLKIKENGNI
jgi:hypothetical protein